MAAEPPTYDLMVLLDTGAPDEQRSKVLADIERLVSQNGGTIVNAQDWGTRSLAYEIKHKKDSEYRLFQFQGPAEVIRALDRALRITDGVVRFRIIKLAPGTPAPPEPRPEPRVTEAPAEQPTPAA